MTIEEKIIWLRAWLRYHGDYHITLDLWDLYGTVGLTISRHSTTLKICRGEHFEKRLDEAMQYCKYLDILLANPSE